MTSGVVERDLREFFAAQTGEIIAAYLFGSVARGTSGARSDVDVAVLYTTTPPATLEGLPLDLASRIEHLVKRPEHGAGGPGPSRPSRVVSCSSIATRAPGFASRCGRGKSSSTSSPFSTAIGADPSRRGDRRRRSQPPSHPSAPGGATSSRVSG